MKAILSEARKGSDPPLIPSVPRTKLPQYTPLLRSYLLSAHSHRSGKVPTAAQIVTPPKLPPRADPSSEEARLLGPFSKRREANIRWRFLSGFREKVYAPLLPEEIEKLSHLSKSATKPSHTRSGKQSSTQQLQQHQKPKQGWGRVHRFTGRFMRRRYQELLDSGAATTRCAGEDGRESWSTRKPAEATVSKTFSATNEDLRWTSK